MKKFFAVFILLLMPLATAYFAWFASGNPLRSIIVVASSVAIAGAIGGLAKCFIGGEFVTPRADEDGGIWRPGWVAHIAVGAIAALVVWGLYGSLAPFNLLGDSATLPSSFKIAELVGSITVGLAGGQILSSIAQQQADKVARDALTDIVRQLTSENENEDTVDDPQPSEKE